MILKCGHTPTPEIGLPYKEGQCRICWLYANNPKYRKHWGGPDLPSLPPMISRAVTAALAATKHAFGGFKTVDPLIKQKRLNICNSCDFYNKHTDRCHKCGCAINIKAAWEEQKCPIDKW